MTAGTLATEQRGAQVVDLDITNSGFVAATAVPYNVKGDIGFFTESFLPGSLSKSIREAARSLPLHVFHDDMPQGQGMTFESWPIGVATEWQDGEDRLRGVWKFDDSEKAQRARKLATPDADGNAMLGYMSIRFTPIRDKWAFVDSARWDPSSVDGKDHVDRVEARLVSVALVSTPVWNQASVDWVRSAGAPGRDTGKRAVDEWAAYLEQIKAGPR
jgi:hypothetical protein